MDIAHISLYRLLISSILMVLLSLWSVFKPSIISFYSYGSSWYGVGIYFGIRSLLFIFCMVGIFFTFNKYSGARRESHETVLVNTSIDPLLTLRAMAFLMVFMGHWFMVTFQPEHLMEMVRDGSMIWLLTSSPWGGVWMFFTLSGYLMAKGFKSERYSLGLESIKNFYRNRCLRIFPLYYIAIILVGALVSPEIFMVLDSNNFDNLISLLTFDSFGSMPIGALWSISTEVQFYFITPFLFLFLSLILTNLVRIILFLVLLIGVSVTYKFSILHFLGLDSWQQYVYKPLLVNLDVFLIGMIVAFLGNYTLNWCKGVKLRMTLAILSAVCLWIILSYWSANTMLGEGGAKTIIFLSFAPIVTSLATAFIILIVDNITVFNSFKSLSPSIQFFWARINLIGLLTYSLYVWHEPILLSFRRIAPSNLSLILSAGYLIVVFPALFCVALFFYRNWELPYDLRRRF